MESSQVASATVSFVDLLREVVGYASATLFHGEAVLLRQWCIQGDM